MLVRHLTSREEDREPTRNIAYRHPPSAQPPHLLMEGRRKVSHPLHDTLFTKPATTGGGSSIWMERVWAGLSQKRVTRPPSNEHQDPSCTPARSLQQPPLQGLWGRKEVRKHLASDLGKQLEGGCMSWAASPTPPGERDLTLKNFSE